MVSSFFTGLFLIILTFVVEYNVIHVSREICQMPTHNTNRSFLFLSVWMRSMWPIGCPTLALWPSLHLFWRSRLALDRYRTLSPRNFSKVVHDRLQWHWAVFRRGPATFWSAWYFPVYNESGEPMFFFRRQLYAWHWSVFWGFTCPRQEVKIHRMWPLWSIKDFDPDRLSATTNHHNSNHQLQQTPLFIKDKFICFFFLQM